MIVTLAWTGWLAFTLMTLLWFAARAEGRELLEFALLEQAAAQDFGQGLPLSERARFTAAWLYNTPILERDFPAWPRHRDDFIARAGWGAE